MKMLDPKILKILEEKTNLATKSIRNALTKRKQVHPSLTPNAVAFLYAQEYNINILKYLDAEDKVGLPSIEKKPVEKIQVKSVAKKKKLETIMDYATADPFIKGHVDEINRAYNAGCYMSVFILGRKIVENLIVDIFVKHFPSNVTGNIDLYYDTTKKRSRDFGEILTNLYKKRMTFGRDKQIVERLYNRAILLKDDANNKTHSWYHLVRTKKEVDDLDIQMTIDLIKKLL